MGYYRSIADLKQLKSDILTLKASEQDIINFVQEMNTITDFDHIESNLEILKIYVILKDMDKFIPLVNLSLNMLLTKIILANENESCTCNDSQSKCCDNKETKICEKTEESINCNVSKQFSELQKALIAKYSPFSREKEPNLKFPDAGEFGNVYFTDNEIVPGKEYRSNVQIDCDGNIVAFISGPTEILKESDYEAIYSGLVGSLFDYQK